MLKLQLQYSGHLIAKEEPTLEKTLMLGVLTAGGEGTTGAEMAGWLNDAMDGDLSKHQEIVKDMEA